MKKGFFNVGKHRERHFGGFDETKHKRDKGKFAPKEGSGKREEDPPDSPVAKTESLHLNSHHGQHDFATVAKDADGNAIGRVEYVLFEDEITVSHVEVSEEHRRKGVATQMYRDILSEHPEATLGTSMKTEDGSALREFIDREFPDRISKKPNPEDAPLEISADEWDSAFEAMKKAKAAGNEQGVSDITDLMNEWNDYDNYVASWEPGDKVPVKPRPFEDPD